MHDKDPGHVSAGVGEKTKPEAGQKRKASECTGMVKERNEIEDDRLFSLASYRGHISILPALGRPFDPLPFVGLTSGHEQEPACVATTAAAVADR